MGTTVPRYFFDIIDAADLHRDEFGDECGDDEDARTQAIRLLHTIASEWSPDDDRQEFAAVVRNEAGTVVYEARLALSGQWGDGGDDAAPPTELVSHCDRPALPGATPAS